MTFGPWHPIEAAAAAAPPLPGVLQARAAGIVDYPRGKSAMLLYDHGGTASLDAHVRGAGADRLRAAQAQGATLVRFGPSRDPAADHDRLLRTFTERFGAPPLVNARVA